MDQRIARGERFTPRYCGRLASVLFNETLGLASLRSATASSLEHWKARLIVSSPAGTMAV